MNNRSAPPNSGRRYRLLLVQTTLPTAVACLSSLARSSLFLYRSGHVVSHAGMREDVVLMKSLNFNAVRCSHYPSDPAFYALCDELGKEPRSDASYSLF